MTNVWPTAPHDKSQHASIHSSGLCVAMIGFIAVAITACCVYQSVI